MILDYKDSAKIQELLGKRVLITKFSTSLCDPDYKTGISSNLVATLIKDSYIGVKFDEGTIVPKYGKRTKLCLAWIEYQLDPDGNY